MEPQDGASSPESPTNAEAEGAEDAPREALRLANRLEKLQELTAALSQARTVTQVADVVIRHGLRVLEADRGALGLGSDDGREVEVLGSRGYPEALVERFRRSVARARR